MTEALANEPGEATTTADALVSLLADLAEEEERFGETLYANFFERCPDALPLFGEYSLSEREEMIRETFRSLLALVESASWVEENLRALGHSHAEYGVEAWMYAPFEHAFLETVASIIERPIPSEVSRELGHLLVRITTSMTGGAAAGA